MTDRRYRKPTREVLRFASAKAGRSGLTQTLWSCRMPPVCHPVPMSGYLNDGSAEAPKLRIYLNAGNLSGLRQGSVWPGGEGAEAIAHLKGDGFEGLQLDGGDFLVEAANDFPLCGQDRVNRPEEAEAVLARHAARGLSCVTLHVGWGTEDDATMDRLVEAVLGASERHRLPAFIETHRATITQDMWRTVELTKRYPEVLFNGDFSHYYCGQEMVYGDFAAKVDFLQPVLDRVAFLHGRVAAPGYMQAPIDSSEDPPAMAVGINYLEHFRILWQRAMRGFKDHAKAGDILVFAPELLKADIYYARVFKDAFGSMVEETDRYAQALLLRDIARDCWARA